MMRALDLFSAAAGGWTLGYACEPCVVGASDVGANHIRKRSWLIGCDPGQLADSDLQSVRWSEQSAPEGTGDRLSGARAVAGDRRGDEGTGSVQRRDGTFAVACDAAQIGRGSRRPGGCVQPVAGPCEPPCRHDADAGETERRAQVESTGDRDGQAVERREGADRHAESAPPCGGNPAHTDEARQPDGRLESGLRPAEIADDGRGDGRRDDGSGAGQMGGRAGAGGAAQEPWADWNGGLARHLRLDDGLSAWVAGARIALGGGRGTAAAGLIVEAFGDAVLPQIPEAIGRAILRTETALDMVLGRSPLHLPGDEQ